MDARGELAELRDGLLQLADGGLEHRLGVRVEPCSEPHLRCPELERERDEALLGAVVEVALDAPALLVAGRHYPHPRLLDARELGP